MRTAVRLVAVVFLAGGAALGAGMALGFGTGLGAAGFLGAGLAAGFLAAGVAFLGGVFLAAGLATGLALGAGLAAAAGRRARGKGCGGRGLGVNTDAAQMEEPTSKSSKLLRGCAQVRASARSPAGPCRRGSAAASLPSFCPPPAALTRARRVCSC